jgi:hypothetical protein
LAAGRFRPREALAELRHAATRQLTAGLFGADARREIPGVDRDAQRRLPMLRVLAPAKADGSAWHVELKGGLDALRPEGLTLILPGLARPVLAPGSFRLEQGPQSSLPGLPVTQGHPGMRLVLHAAHPGLAPGVFAR